jgi:protocatechuate 3,4-dioxygenase beta subunit
MEIMKSGIIENSEEVTPAVLRAMAGAPSGRLRTVMEAFVRHIHAFAQEVKLTEAEYDLGIDFLNRIGQATHDSHNEGILFADAIGFSTLVCLLNNGNAGATETAAALLGPFWRANSPMTANGGSIVRSATPGPELFVECEFVDAAGRPLADVEVDVWQSSPVGLYENQDDSQADMNLRGKFITDDAGRFSFRSVKPAGYPVPTDGPVGDLLRAQRRHPYRPAHIHFLGIHACRVLYQFEKYESARHRHAHCIGGPRRRGDRMRRRLPLLANLYGPAAFRKRACA